MALDQDKFETWWILHLKDEKGVGEEYLKVEGKETNCNLFVSNSVFDIIGLKLDKNLLSLGQMLNRKKYSFLIKSKSCITENPSDCN